ncbi:MAG: hypothetical protein OHK0039_46630 [Bacteroidia bacterium]
MPKTVIVAREIAEIDPYLRVTCFHEGITPENIADFLDSEGGLDLLIEECDSLEIKVLARQEARKRGIPVIIDTSDRGMLDVERYDLDPHYPLLHGRIAEDLSYAFLKSLKTSEEKLPYILPILGADSLSPRMKLSLPEIGKSLTTWPQLGSDVLIGGALCAHAARRVLLGMPLPSGRQYADMEALLPG